MKTQYSHQKSRLQAVFNAMIDAELGSRRRSYAAKRLPITKLDIERLCSNGFPKN